MGLFLLLLVVSGAPTADDVSQAKVHFQAGKAHYQLGNFSDAIREFAAGYALTQSPDFLINLGQAYRAQGDTAKALDMFDKYLEKAPADAPARKQVEALAASLREKEAPPQAPPQDAPVRAADAPPPTAPAPELVRAEPPAEHHVSTLAWAIPVVAVAVVGAVVAGVAIGVSRTPSCASPPSLGCLDLRNK
jgi:tetratricopeptide (TPR) repeat protein